MEEYKIKMELQMDLMQAIFGQYDAYIAQIEKNLKVSVVNRDGYIHIIGEKEACEQTKRLIDTLTKSMQQGAIIDQQRVNYVIDLNQDGEDVSLEDMDKSCICHTVAGKPIKPKTFGQMKYVNAMKDHMIVFCLGPAGTGKTYLAMAMAITAFKNNEVERIILTRPAIEAGEKLGFLPGDLQSKVDPYLRPLYDALYQIMGAESFQKNMEKGLIEVAPLAYMRGRTLDNAYIILDEAQNTTQAQMKMFLTRIGFGSKVVITGDLSQKDLGAGVVSGLDVATKVLGKVDDIAFCELSSKDVVRHPLVQKIVKAYEEYEKKETREKRENKKKNEYAGKEKRKYTRRNTADKD